MAPKKPQELDAVLLVVLKAGQGLAVPAQEPAAVRRDTHPGDVAKGEDPRSPEGRKIAELLAFHHQTAAGVADQENAQEEKEQEDRGDTQENRGVIALPLPRQHADGHEDLKACEEDEVNDADGPHQHPDPFFIPDHEGRGQGSFRRRGLRPHGAAPARLGGNGGGALAGDILLHRGPDGEHTQKADEHSHAEVRQDNAPVLGHQNGFPGKSRHADAVVGGVSLPLRVRAEDVHPGGDLRPEEGQHGAEDHRDGGEAQRLATVELPVAPGGGHGGEEAQPADEEIRKGAGKEPGDGAHDGAQQGAQDTESGAAFLLRQLR